MKILFSRRKVMKYEKIFKTKKEELAFTLVELIMTVAIITILALISVPLLYNNYTKDAKWAEAYSLLGGIKSAEMAYYSQYGMFYTTPDWTFNDPVLGVNSRNNKYFISFYTYTKTNGNSGINPQNAFFVDLSVPTELRTDNLWVYGTKYALSAAGYSTFLSNKGQMNW